MLRKRKIGSVKAFVSPIVAGGVSTAVNLTISMGSKGADVVTLQKILFDLGNKITVDGDFGPQTDTVVKKFQKSNKMTIDGIVTDVVMDMIRQTLDNNIKITKLSTGSFEKKG